MIQAGITKLLSNLLAQCTMNLVSHSLSVVPFHGGVGRKGAGQSRAVSSPMLRSPETSQVSTPASNMRRCSPSHKCMGLRLPAPLLFLSFLIISPRDKSSWSDNDISM
jgi:hypothetical protein